MTVARTGIQLGGNKYRATRTDEKEKSFPVEPSVRVPDFQDMQGNIIKPKWVEINREAVVKIPRPDPKFVASRYPHQLPAVRSSHE